MLGDDIWDLDSKVRQFNDRHKSDDPLSHNRLIGMPFLTNHRLGRYLDDVHSSDDVSERTKQSLYEVRDKIELEGDQHAQMALHAMSDRTSSRPDSEALIIGSSLGLDVTGILAAPTEYTMIALIKNMRYVLANMLFTLGPRLTEPGFRWAPASVLRSKGACVATIVQDLVPLDLEQLRKREAVTRLMSTLDKEGRGSLSFNPGTGIDRLYGFHEGADRRLAFETLGTTYAVSGIDEDLGASGRDGQYTVQIENMLGECRRLAIVVSELDPSQLSPISTLVEVLSESKSFRESRPLAEGAKKARFCMLVLLSAHVPANITETMRRDGQNERFPGKEGMTVGRTPYQRKAKYDAEWLEPRCWLVD